MSLPQPSSPKTGSPEPAYEVVLQSGPLGPPGPSLLKALKAGFGAAASRFADLYVLGARAVLDRKERLEDDLAARSARRASGESPDGFRD